MTPPNHQFEGCVVSIDVRADGYGITVWVPNRITLSGCAWVAGLTSFLSKELRVRAAGSAVEGGGGMSPAVEASLLTAAAATAGFLAATVFSPPGPFALLVLLSIGLACLWWPLFLICKADAEAKRLRKEHSDRVAIQRREQDARREGAQA